jgi:hypothetical protein
VTNHNLFFNNNEHCLILLINNTKILVGFPHSLFSPAYYRFYSIFFYFTGKDDLPKSLFILFFSTTTTKKVLSSNMANAFFVVIFQNHNFKTAFKTFFYKRKKQLILVKGNMLFGDVVNWFSRSVRDT